MKEFKLSVKDNKKLHMYKWDEVSNPKAIIQLVHGSCEHAYRYDEFCKFLNKNGYLVYANDHRGHGKTEDKLDDLGFFDSENGWDKVVDDLKSVTDYIKKEDPNLPIIMFGHSMGSFLARHYAILYGDEIKGVVLSGTAHNPKGLLKFGVKLSNMEIKHNGERYRSKLLNKLSYESFNKRIKPLRTKQDWISTDKEVVDKFLGDERCGFVFTASAFRDMFNGLLFITNEENIKKMNKKLPILIVSGKEDPVGGYEKMVKKTYNCYKRLGIEKVDIKLYDGMRHEILNEVNKQQVYDDILGWINTILN